MVELRKRKPAPAPVVKAAKVTKKTKPVAASRASTGASKAKPAAAPAAPARGKVSVGDVVDLAGFGDEVLLSDGTPTTLSKLVHDSKNGVVLFTYPKASTPGCTTQVCLFRDNYKDVTSTGFDIYGLSADSPKANTTFKTKQNLPYPLLCDPKATLIAAIGLKKSPSGTQRGVFVVNKDGKVLVAEPGGPAATLDAVKKLIT